MNHEVFNLNNLLTALIGLFMIYLNSRFSALKEQIEEMKKELDEVKKENNEIKKNYLSRFERLADQIHLIKEEIIAEFNKMNVSVEKQLSYCELVQETKKKERQEIEEIKKDISTLKNKRRTK